jgi:DNA-binding NarL/FixJ family response regulator
MKSSLRPIPSTTVYIVDDHPLFASMLSEVLTQSGEFKLLGTAGDGATALEFLRQTDVDIVLVDLLLPEVSGLEFLAALRELRPKARPVVLSGLTSDESVAAAFSAGAATFISKRADVTEILATLRGVARGNFPLTQDLGRVLQGMVRSQLDSKPLGASDVKILKRIAEHASVKEIAAEMGFSLSGVYKAKARIAAHTGAKNWQGMYSSAVKYGLVPPEPWMFAPRTAAAGVPAAAGANGRVCV